MNLPFVCDLEWLRGNCEPEPNTGCWLWTGRCNSQGYGRLHKTPTRPGLAIHRLAWALANGTDPLTMDPKMCVRHSCDTPNCVNPDHLTLGTWKENVHDAKRRGRHAVAFQEVNGQVVGHCKNGHDLAVVGVYDYGVQKDGYRFRVCLACKRGRNRAYARRMAQDPMHRRRMAERQAAYRAKRGTAA